MNVAEVEIKGNEVIISNRNRPIFILSIFAALTTIALLIPILATLIAFKETIEITFGLLLSYLLCWGIAVYFIRIILWNVYGKEIIEIRDSKVEYLCSYKFFIDNKMTLNLENIEIIQKENEDETKSTLILGDKENMFETNYNISRQDILRIENKIKNAL